MGMWLACTTSSADRTGEPAKWYWAGQVLDAAAVTVASNDDDGVAEALERFVLS